MSRRVLKSDAIDPEAIGVEVSWSFGDGSADAVRLPRVEVIHSFRVHGFPAAADAIELELDANEALRRARASARNRSWLVVRELEHPNRKTDMVLGVYVRRGTTGGETGDGWEMAARVKRGSSGDIRAFPPEGVASYPADERGLKGVEEAERLALLATTLRTTALNSDVSEALVAACHSAGCVSRRPGGGGVYLVFAGPGCERLVDLLSTLEFETGAAKPAGRFTVQMQEVYPKPLTNRSWAASCEAQLEGSVARLMGDLEALVAEGTMREKTMAKRGDEADALVKLADRCSVFMGAAATAMQERAAKIGKAFRDAISEDLTAAHALLAGVSATSGAAASEEYVPSAPKVVELAPEPDSDLDSVLADLAV